MAKNKPVVQRVVIALLASAFLLTHLVTLARYPVADCDEAHYSNVASVFLERGVFGNDLTGMDRPIAQNSTGVGRLFALGAAFFFRWLGVSLFSARLFSLAGYLATIALLYFAGRSVFHPTTGLLAAALFALSWIALLHGHSGRPDIWPAAGGVFTFFLLYLAVSRKRIGWAGAAGLVAALTLELHLNGIHFLAASAAIAMAWGLRRRAWAWLCAYGSGVACGLFIWFFGHYVMSPVPTAMVQELAATTVQLSMAGKLTGLVDWWWRQYWVGTNYESLLQGLYFGLGLGTLVIRRESKGRMLIAYIILSALSFALVVLVQEDWYRTLWMPLLCLAAAEGVRVAAEKLSGWRQLDARWQSILPLVLAAPLMAGYLLGDAHLLYKFRDVNYDNVVAQFEDHIPGGSRVAAEATWWYGLSEQREFLDDILFDEETRRVDPENLHAALAGVLEKWKFDYVIYDGLIACYTDIIPAAVELERVLDERCVPVASISDKWFGENTVYRCGQSTAVGSP